jgi:hypothetical protein
MNWDRNILTWWLPSILSFSKQKIKEEGVKVPYRWVLSLFLPEM